MNDKERFAKEIIIRNHVHKHHKKAWATTNDYGSGIGIVTMMTCLNCKKTFNITDYGRW